MNGQRVAESGHLDDPRQVLLRHLVLPYRSILFCMAINFAGFSSAFPRPSTPHTQHSLWTLVETLEGTPTDRILVFNKKLGLHSHQRLRPPHNILNHKIIYMLNPGT